MALQIVGLSVALFEIDAASVEPLRMEVACGTGCALLPESVIARLRISGVWRDHLGRMQDRRGRPHSRMCPSLSEVINALAEPERERSMIAA